MSDNKENIPPEQSVEEILSRSFQALWYQAETLHKREMDCMKEQTDKLIQHFNDVTLKMETNSKDLTFQFSQDIIATFKDMRVFEENHLLQIITMLFLILKEHKIEFPPKPLEQLEEDDSKTDKEEVEEEDEPENTTSRVNDTLLNAEEHDEDVVA